MSPSLTFWLPNIVLILAYILIAMERIPKVVIALLGASIMLLAHIVTQEEAFAYIDFNVIFLLVGMMIIVNILKHTGAINALALFAVKSVNGSGVRLMLTLSLITAILSAVLDNVTTVIIVGMVTCSLSRQLNISPVPYLITEALASNVGGTATLIGDPPNIMIGSAAGLSFTDFLVHLTPVILLILPVTLVTLAYYYKDELNLSQSAKEAIENMSLEGVITDKPLLWKALIILSLVIIGFIFHHQLHLEAATVALAGAATLMLFEDSHDIWNDVEWTTIFFFVGLFIIVGAVEKVGTIHLLAEKFFEVTQGSFTVMTMVILWASGFLSAFLDNIPYTATMIPLIQALEIPNHHMEALWWALALGACLGGNGTMIGASANVLIADMAVRNGHPIEFLKFMKIGMIIMIESLVIASIYIWLRYLIF